MREHVSRTNSAVRTTAVCRAAGSVTMTTTVAITQMRKSAVCISTDLSVDTCLTLLVHAQQFIGLNLVFYYYLWPSHMSVRGIVGILSYVMAHSRCSLMHLTSCCLYSSFHTDPLAWLRGRSLLPPNHLFQPLLPSPLSSHLPMIPCVFVTEVPSCSICPLVEKW